ncbi:MAG: hypothetical protein BAJALOKI3v1_130050 [Promethearchaeota archaeon]|nr:MAG: hypothetical protein BAJALOKI3v1_130050 [Candidatus Lokiarchaeota archaeon]
MDFDGNIIRKMIDWTLNTSRCSNCEITIGLSRVILINARNAMFSLNPTNSQEHKENKLKKYGLVFHNGKIFLDLFQ